MLLYWVDCQRHGVSRCARVERTAGTGGNHGSEDGGDSERERRRLGHGRAAGGLSGDPVHGGRLSSIVGGDGVHFFQFDNILWRLRGNGQAFRDSADHFYSVPQLIDVDNAPSTLFPAYAWGRTECDRSQFVVIPQGVLDGPAQHPTLCRLKAFPSSSAPAEDVLLSYCVKRLPQGLRYREY